jgi:thiol-disulfide isomerase/thioredoxin
VRNRDGDAISSSVPPVGSMSVPRAGPPHPLERLGPEAFDGERLLRTGTWAVAFLADWCPFCRSFLPSFAALDGSNFGVAIADLTDQGNSLWERFEIEVVPSVIVFRDGTAVFRADGRFMEGLGPKDLAAVRSAATEP